MHRCLKGLLSIITDSYSPREETSRNNQDSADNHNLSDDAHSRNSLGDMSWGVSSDTSSSAGETSDPEMSEAVFYIKMILSQLTRITMAIRKASTKYRFDAIDQVLQEREKEQSFVDFRTHLTSIILSGFYDPRSEKLDVMGKIKRSSDYGRLNPVQRRLVKANLLRRNRIEVMTKSRIARTEQFSQDFKPKEISGVQPDPIAVGPDNATEQLRSLTSHSTPDDSDRNVGDTGSVAITNAPTATDAGSGSGIIRHIKDILSNDETSSRITHFTKIGAAQAYPPCPKPREDGTVICSYCADPLPPLFLKDKNRWKYVLQLASLNDVIAQNILTSMGQGSCCARSHAIHMHC
jgi:hypothetical protein